MKRITPGRAVLRSIAALLLSGATVPCLALCTDTTIPVYQCGTGAFFAPPPSNAGTMTAVWWQLGYGNLTINNGTVAAGALEGTGINPSGVFSGNDSGVASLPLTPAGTARPDLSGIPAGASCLSDPTWADPGLDGCADNPRGAAAANFDDLINPYFSILYGSCPPDLHDCTVEYYRTEYQIDYPMAVLLRESTNRFYSLAFVASHPRQDPYDPPALGGKAKDVTEGYFDLADVSNGDSNPAMPGENNMIPWQDVPRPRVDAVTGPVNGFYTLGLSWNNVRLVHDASLRFSSHSPSLPTGGVGVLQQSAAFGGLCRFQIQTAAVTAADPDPTQLLWTNAVDPITCGDPAVPIVTTTLSVAADTAIRIRTFLGKRPRTTSTTLANVRLAAAGDLGYEATDCMANDCVNSPPILIVGGFLASEKAVDTVARWNRNAVEVTFRTTSELKVSSLDILGKGDAVLRNVACAQCTTGIGSSYAVTLSPGELKGAKELRVRLNGPGTTTHAFPVQSR